MVSEPTNSSAPSEVTPIDGDVLCPQCGYSLRGLLANRCPECGVGFDRATLTASNIPWVWRRAIGRWWAYGQTVWMVVRHNDRLCDEFALPVSFRDAQRFRWTTVLHAYLPLLAVTLLGYAGCWGFPSQTEAIRFLFDEWWPTLSLHLGVLVLLAAATGVPSYFFHPRSLPLEQQNRAIALSYYTCAPLSWTCLALLVAVLIKTQLALLAGLVLMLSQSLLWWWYLVRLARRTLCEASGRIVVVAVAVPIAWLAIAVLSLVGVPYLVNYFCLVWVSLS